MRCRGTFGVGMRLCPISSCSEEILPIDGRTTHSRSPMAVRGPSQSDGSYYMQLSPGTHKIGVRHRYPGGCNVGYLSAWGWQPAHRDRRRQRHRVTGIG